MHFHRLNIYNRNVPVLQVTSGVDEGYCKSEKDKSELLHH